MPSFRYRAVTAEGQIVQGMIDGDGPAHALDRIRGLGLTPIEAVEGRAAARDRRHVGSAARRAFVHKLGELGVLLGAGLTLDRALAVCLDNAQDPAGAELLRQVSRRVREGAPLSVALSGIDGLLPPMASAMVEAGETNGRLDIALDRLTVTLEREEELKATIRGAMIYPAVLLVLALSVIGLLLFFVVPQFENLFSAQADLPFATRVVIGLSRTARSYGWLAVTALAGLAIAARAWLSSPAVRRRLDSVLLRVPSIGELTRKIETARFARVLGSLVEAGVLVPTALAIARRSLANGEMADAVEGVAQGLKRGGGLSGPLAVSGVFPKIAISFLRTGEETAQLGLMLGRLAELLDQDVRKSLQTLIAILVPSITIAMGAAVAGVIASVMTAILGFNDLALPT
jgi:general secretion pathway protein F